MHENRVPADFFQLAQSMPFHDVHFWRDTHSQLEAIIVIHSTKLGPAVGGCRFLAYDSSQRALEDALRLAKSMSYKAAINHLPYGGGKAVLLKPAVIKDRKALFTSFGEFVESLNGRYIAAMDSGTNIEDMNIIASKTPHVFCTSHTGSASGDPSPYTARGVYYGIKAAVKLQLHQESLKGIHVAIQGVGHVGYHLAKLLYADGVKISVSDLNTSAINRVVAEFDATAVSPEAIYNLDCDVFSPCALGQIINASSIQRLRCKIIAGAANNQLETEETGQLLPDKGILYAPDYVINSGGLLQIANPNDDNALNQKLAALYDTLLTIFEISHQQNIATTAVADQMAEAVLDQSVVDKDDATETKSTATELTEPQTLAKHYYSDN